LYGDERFAAGYALVWRRPPLRIESKGLVKYKYHTISKEIQIDSVRMLVTSDYCSPIRTEALCCQDNDVWNALIG